MVVMSRLKMSKKMESVRGLRLTLQWCARVEVCGTWVDVDFVVRPARELHKQSQW